MACQWRLRSGKLNRLVGRFINRLIIVSIAWPQLSSTPFSRILFKHSGKAQASGLGSSFILWNCPAIVFMFLFDRITWFACPSIYFGYVFIITSCGCWSIRKVRRQIGRPGLFLSIGCMLFLGF